MDYHSAGGIVFHSSTKVRKYLVLYQKRKSGETQWVFPKGRVEIHETSEQAAIREIREESGLKHLSIVGFVGAQNYKFLEANGVQSKKTVDWFLVEAKRPNELSLARKEGFLRSRWIDFEQATRVLTHPAFHPYLRKAHKMKSA